MIAGVLLAGTAGCGVTAPAPEFVSYFIENRTHEQLELSRESPGREDYVGTIGPCITAAWEDWDPDPRVALSVNGQQVWQSAEFPRPDASIVYVLIEEDGTVSARLIGASPNRPANVCGGVPAPSAAPGAGSSPSSGRIIHALREAVRDGRRDVHVDVCLVATLL